MIATNGFDKYDPVTQVVNENRTVAVLTGWLAWLLVVVVCLLLLLVLAVALLAVVLLCTSS